MPDNPTTPRTRPDRRTFLTTALGTAAAVAANSALAQQIPPPATNRDYATNAPIRYPDPDIVTLDSRFAKYVLFNTAIKRLHTGSFWAEGPAWNGVGRFLVWSDIPSNLQYRWLEDDGEGTVFRNPSGNSNGNTFDFQGRQISCEHGGRRVARYEPDGSVTTIADRYQGKRLNSPNDAVVHPDGSIWFTDPMYGINGDYEGNRAESETPPAVYRADPQSGQITLIDAEVTGPNGLCFSPDYSKLYVADTGVGATKVHDVVNQGAGARVRNSREFVRLKIPGGGGSSADGIRCDVEGNVWCGANPGVQIVAPDGTQIGMIRLPEQCANIAFGGPKRNRLFMTASQSLYAVYVGVKGAGTS